MQVRQILPAMVARISRQSLPYAVHYCEPGLRRGFCAGTLAEAAHAAGRGVIYTAASAGGRALLNKFNTAFNQSTVKEEIILALRPAVQGEQPQFVPWAVQDQYLHEVFDDLDYNVHHATFSYTDEKDRTITLQPTKAAVERMLSELRSRSEVVVYVDWKPPSRMVQAAEQVRNAKQRAFEMVVEAKRYIAGGGAVTEEAVKSAEQKVEDAGAKLMPTKDVRSLLVRSVHAQHWSEASEDLMKEMGLLAFPEDEQERARAAFRNASRGSRGEARYFSDSSTGGVLSSRMVVYRTELVDEEMHMVYGISEMQCVLPPKPLEPEVLPRDLCIQMDGRFFAVLPPASPHSSASGYLPHDCQWFDLPRGWHVVDSAAKGFDQVAQNIIAKYGWHANVLVLRHGTSYPGYLSAHSSEGGKRWHQDCQQLEKAASGRRFRLSANGLRMLVEQEKVQTTPHTELINNWRKLLMLRSEHEWGRHLDKGMPVPLPE